jgi:hypothetical protein
MPADQSRKCRLIPPGHKPAQQLRIAAHLRAGIENDRASVSPFMCGLFWKYCQARAKVFQFFSGKKELGKPKLLLDEGSLPTVVSRTNG